MSSSVDRSAPEGATLDLEAIRERLATNERTGWHLVSTATAVALLAEVDRLRAELSDARTALGVHSGATTRNLTDADWRAVTRALAVLEDRGDA